jgi:anti-anti-sigma factor
MTEDLRLTIERRGNHGAIIYTRGYINNVGGDEIANRAYELMDQGVTTLLLNLAETKIVNSIGISILIEIIEKMMEKGGRLAFCCLTPVIQKTFQIMGLAQFSTIYSDQETAVKELSLESGS